MHATRPEWLLDVRGADALFDWFGYWPDFHDAEILELILTRSGISSVLIHTWETTDKLDDKGFYLDRKQVLVRFLLEGVEDLSLTEFNAQNVISRAAITKFDGGFRLELEPCYGLAGTLTAAKIAIELEPVPTERGARK